MRVLIVDDEPMLAATLQRLLDASSIAADIATSGTQGLSLFQQHPYDLVLCDLTLRDLPGLSLLGALQKAHPGAEKRIIFMTGGDLSPHESALLARHGNLVLEKPFSPAELLAAIEQVRAG